MGEGGEQSSSSNYSTDDVRHETDFETPLHHGILRYVPSSADVSLKADFPTKLDRSYIYVPAGYVQQNPQHFLTNILEALHLKTLPNLVVVTAETEGTMEEQMNGFQVVRQQQQRQQQGNNVDLSASASTSASNEDDDNQKNNNNEFLRAKMGQLVEASMETFVELGAWILPQNPRCQNGMAQMICETLQRNNTASSNSNNKNKGAESHQASSPVVALGLVGLTHDDEQSGFAACVRENMKPYGSRLQKVAKVEYNPNNNCCSGLVEGEDGERKGGNTPPCPHLTHLVLFASPLELELFRTALLGQVPDILLGLGNLTDKALQSAYQNAKEGSPIVLFNHTGTKVDSLIRMFRHVKTHMTAAAAAAAEISHPSSTSLVPEGAALQSSPPPPAPPHQHQQHQHDKTKDSTAPSASSSSSKQRKVLPPPPIPGETNELIRLFINTWPSDFQIKSVVLVNPLSTLASPKRLQKRILAAITASFDIQEGSYEVRLAKHQALEYAKEFLQTADQHVLRKQYQARVLTAQLILCTLASIVASVLYDRYYGGGTNHHRPNANASAGSSTAAAATSSSAFQTTGFVLTILLPLYVTSLKQESDKGSPLLKYGAFCGATERIRSEILKFRAQVGPYRPADKTYQEMRKPIERFTTKIREIWKAVELHLSDDGMSMSSSRLWALTKTLPPVAGASAAAVGATARIDKMLGGATQNALLESTTTTTAEKFKSITKEGVGSGFLHQHDLEKGAMDILFENETVVTESSPLLSPTLPSNKKSHAATIPPAPTPTGLPVSGETEDDSDDEDDDVSVEDDCFSPITAEEYMEIRMKQITDAKVQEVESMVCWNGILGRSIKVITIFSGATAALSLQWIVPIVLGVTAALATGQEFLRYPRRIELGNALVVQLNGIKLWWMGLSVYQRQLPANKDTLILKAEKAILAEVQSKLNGPQKADDDDDDDR